MALTKPAVGHLSITRTVYTFILFSPSPIALSLLSLPLTRLSSPGERSSVRSTALDPLVPSQ